MAWEGGGVIPDASEQHNSMELWLGVDDEPAESMWFTIRGATYKGDIAVGICYRLCDQEER